MLRLAALGATVGLLAAMAGAAPRELPPVPALKPNPEMPDPMVMFDGTRVTSREQWERERRPELKRLFQHYMYGRFPPPPRKVHATVEHTDAHCFGGKATLREVALRYGPEGTPPLHLLVITPNTRKGPAPAFLGIAFCGNHAIVTDPAVRIPGIWMYPGEGVVD